MRAQPQDNLPAELTSFVGRRETLTRAKNLLAQSRLLTLTGMGGIGKTRLALRLANETRRTFPDGAWLVELADLRHGTLLPQAISGALGLRDESSDPVGILIDHLRGRGRLLVLDNCEHLAESCAVLIDRALRAVPTLKIVATSRHMLGVEGEQVLPVPSLPHDSGECGVSEAMELFEERAASADPNFRLTSGNRDTVAAICGQLEGLPLAVELAAANVRSFSPADILDRLGDSELLTASERTRPNRHRTLTAAIEWSYRLCSAQERRTWEELSVFSGGFTLDSAEAVCTAANGVSTVLSAVASLVDKSVVVRLDGLHDTPTRYRMLEPVRQYAAEKLAGSPIAPAVRRRHYDYFQRLARRCRTDYCSSRDIEWYATTRMELPNLRQALDFGLSEREPLAPLDMATALRSFWQQSGSLLEGYRWLRRALDNGPGPSRERAAGLACAAILAFLLEDAATARKLLDEHIGLATAHGYTEFRAVARFASALDTIADGDFDAAVDRCERAVEAAIELDDPGTVCEGMALSALCAVVCADSRAEALATRFVDYTEARDLHLLKAIALYPLGAVRWRNGDTVTATLLMREAIRLYQMFEHPGMVAVCVEGLAWSVSEDDPEVAATLLGAAKSIWRHSQMRLPETAVRQVGQSIETRLRQQLGDLSFDHAYTTGLDLSFGDAVKLALGEPAEQEVRSADPASRVGLTRREREIAVLVADGLTNREIATKLVISPRTAEAHVEHILAKLGFRSRTQIARWLDQVR